MKYFKKSEQNDLAKCDICGKELKLPGGGTTTSLITHLMSLHKIILKRKSSESEDIKPKVMDAMMFLRQYYKNKAKNK